jgi:hypothetical protein
MKRPLGPNVRKLITLRMSMLAIPPGTLDPFMAGVRAILSALHPTCRCLDEHLSRWAKRKYKRLRGHHRRARHWLRRIARTQPELFAHWRYFQSMAGQ